MKIIVGLGNPGNEYKGTRHNVGFITVEKIAEDYGISLTKAGFQALYGQGRIDGEQLILVKPMTYMNLSGMAVRQIMDYYKVEAKDLIVIQDDIDISKGTIKIKSKGSAGTHNGMKSVIKHLGHGNFSRIKIGVGNPSHGKDLADFVLSKFSKEEIDEIDSAIDQAAKATVTWVKHGTEVTMNEFNKKVKKEQE
ncbi:MAG: aminoacyl-tRNA hydrolase [Tissierellia bacterium]|nr:aminoacyl-tRNA hydrolase [Tissierellia bacterium]